MHPVRSEVVVHRDNDTIKIIIPILKTINRPNCNGWEMSITSQNHGLKDDGRHLEKRKGSFRLSFQRKGRQGRNRNNNNTLVASFTVGQYSHPSSPQQQQRQESHSSPTTVDFRRKSFKSSVANRQIKQIKQEQSMHTTFAVLAVWKFGASIPEEGDNRRDSARRDSGSGRAVAMSMNAYGL